jgi:lysophospholipase L1-like esterase
MTHTLQGFVEFGRENKCMMQPAIEPSLRRLSLSALAALAFAGASLALGPAALATDRDRDQQWVGTWSASPSDGATGFNNQTLRLIVHTSIGGDDIRVRLSNLFGAQSLVIGAAHVAISSGGAGIVPGSDRPLTFSGASAITIPPGALVLSDPVELRVQPLSNLAVSIYVPGDTGPATEHSLGMQTNYISGPGDFTGATLLPVSTTAQSWFFLSGVEVKASKRTRAIVAFGDSITDGYCSTVGANRRWPNVLAERLLAHKHHSNLAVLDEGISGNRILHNGLIPIFGPNALARFDRDVLVQTGVKYVIVLEGINDFGHAAPGTPEAVNADDIIEGYRQLIARAHEQGLKIFGGTLTPYKGTIFPGYFNDVGEANREKVNQWIRTSRAFDAVIDFEAAVRDPKHLQRIVLDNQSQMSSSQLARSLVRTPIETSE